MPAGSFQARDTNAPSALKAPAHGER